MQTVCKPYRCTNGFNVLYLGATTNQNKTTTPVIIKAKFVGVDEWSRVVIETEKGTRLCDIQCLDSEVLKAEPLLGHWHTITADYGEPISAIKPSITIEIDPESFQQK